MFDMCDEAVTLEYEEHRVAIKPVKCRECRRMIGAGEPYLEEGWYTDDLFDDEEPAEGEGRPMRKHITCVHCQVARSWLSDECGGFVFGMIEEDIREHVQESPGHYSYALYRFIVLMSWNWQRKGALVPVPEKPPIPKLEMK